MRNPRGPRRGTIYSLVLFSTMLVAAIALASLQIARLQGGAVSDDNDFVEAAVYARSALEIGMLKIRDDPYWRRNFGNGDWVVNQPIGGGTFSLSAADPIDNDVVNGENHPLILSATGMKGRARYKASVRLEVGPRVGSCLEVSMISGSDTTVNAATLASDQTVSANGKYNAGGGSIVNANVEAYKGIGGSTYTKAIANRTSPRNLPDPNHCLDYYLTSGTTINYSDLPLFSPAEMLTNTTFEIDLSGWRATGLCTLQQSATKMKEGLYSLKVTNRGSATAVAAQDLPLDSLLNGNTYNLVVPILPSAACTAQAVLTITSTESGTQAFATPLATLAKNLNDGTFHWTDLKGPITPTWSGALTAACVSVSISVKNDYYIDKVSMVDVTYPKGAYIIDRALLTPSSNPYGSRETNPMGIYVINCSGKTVGVGNSRIVGTLVFVRPGGNSEIRGPLVWEAAQYNYPALLADSSIAITCASPGLSESALGLNFNPPGTPYPYAGGTANATPTDSYPCKITGLVYTKGDLTWSGSPAAAGVMIANGQIKVNATSLSLNYGNVYLNDPPPGFNVGTVNLKVVPGTWQRSVD